VSIESRAQIQFGKEFLLIRSTLFDYKEHNQEQLISAMLEVATFVLRYYVW